MAFRLEQNWGGFIASTDRACRLASGVFTRRKAAEEGAARHARRPSGLDLNSVGIRSSLGVGIYVLAGDVAKNYAGPAVVLSLLLVAVVSVLAGLCYAELGARVPKAGSIYVCSYVCVGEFMALIMGWNLILQYILGAASVAKALSEYLDSSLLENVMSTNLQAIMPLDSPHLARYPDLFAFSVIMLFSGVVLAFGVKAFAKFYDSCMAVNVSVMLFVIISGCFKADTKNWGIPASEVPKYTSKDFGSGGFAPYGLAGIVKGAAVCFYGFLDFDCVVTASAESRQPRNLVPYGMALSLLVMFLVACSPSAVLTLSVPYFLQDEKAPFAFIYEQLGWPWAKHVVSAGALCALCCTLVCAVFPLPRIIYAMSNDGLLYRCMGRVSERFQTPLVGTIVAGLFTGALAMIFELKQLIHMMCIATLFAHTMVAACVLLLRYERTPPREDEAAEPLKLSVRAVLRQLVNADGLAAPTRLSAAVVTALVTAYGIWCFIMMHCVNQYGLALWSQPGALAAFAVGALLVVATLVAISRQPVSEKKLAFSVALVPWLPGLSILANVYLMLSLDHMAWFAVWIAAGLLIYATYGAWHSAERRRNADADEQLAEVRTEHDPRVHLLTRRNVA